MEAKEIASSSLEYSCDAQMPYAYLRLCFGVAGARMKQGLVRLNFSWKPFQDYKSSGLPLLPTMNNYAQERVLLWRARWLKELLATTFDMGGLLARKL